MHVPDVAVRVNALYVAAPENSTVILSYPAIVSEIRMSAHSVAVSSIAVNAMVPARSK